MKKIALTRSIYSLIDVVANDMIEGSEDNEYLRQAQSLCSVLEELLDDDRSDYEWLRDWEWTDLARSSHYRTDDASIGSVWREWDEYDDEEDYSHEEEKTSDEDLEAYEPRKRKLEGPILRRWRRKGGLR